MADERVSLRQRTQAAAVGPSDADPVLRGDPIETNLARWLLGHGAEECAPQSEAGTMNGFRNGTHGPDDLDRLVAAAALTLAALPFSALSLAFDGGDLDMASLERLDRKRVLTGLRYAETANECGTNDCSKWGHNLRGHR